MANTSSTSTSTSKITESDLRTRALVTFVKETFFQLDELAHLKKQGCKATISSALFKEMCSVIREFNPEFLARYHEVLTSLAVRASAPQRAKFSEEFAIAESPIRKRFIARMREELTRAA